VIRRIKTLLPVAAIVFAGPALAQDTEPLHTDFAEAG
jgi:hypothetical protein